MHGRRKLVSIAERIPLAVVAMGLVAALGLSFLPLWPFAEDTPIEVFMNREQVRDEAMRLTIVRDAGVANLGLVDAAWRNFVAAAAWNLYALLPAVVFASLVPRYAILRARGVFPVRTVGVGIAIGILLAGLCSCAFRAFFIVFGDANRTFPAGLLFVAFCPPFLASWSERGRRTSARRTA